MEDMPMEKIRIVIAEDDEPSRRMMRRLLEAVPYTEVVAEATDGEQLIHHMLTEEPHLVLLDINMPKLDGIHAIQECVKILPELKIIVTSGYPDYAVDAFNLSAVDYLIKPIERTRLYAAIEKARRFVHSKRDEEWKQLKQLNIKGEKFMVQAEGIITFVPIKDILFFEKEGRKTLLHTLNRVLEVTETLGSILQRLNPAIFLQTHRSYIVNFDQVSFIKPSGDTNLVYFHNYDHPAYISKNRMLEILKILRGSERT
jgi:two-component system, LytTR family, response regulator